MKLLFVSKDLGGGTVSAPLARIALDNGDEVTVITEGLAPPEFRARGVPLYFQGTPNLTEIPFSVDALQALRVLRPDVVITTEAWPIHLEESFGLAANKLAIPLIFLEDTQGGYVRTKATPHAVFVVDEYAARLVQEHYSHVEVWVVGHPGVPTEEEIEVIRDCSLSHLKSEGKRVYAYVGGDSETTGEQLQLLIQCFAITSGEWVLIPRFHPKWVSVREPVSGKTFEEFWMSMLDPISSRVLPDSVGDGRKLVASADVSLADASTLLTTAVCCGKTSVLLETSSVIRAIKKDAGLDVMPLVALGCAHSVHEPTDLSLLTPPDPSLRSSLKPYDPIRAYQYIQELVK